MNSIIKQINLRKVFTTSISILLLICIWLITALVVDKEYLIPYPSSVVKSLFNLISQKNFLSIIQTTLTSCFISFFISFILAMILAITSYIFPILEDVFKPIINILKAVPTISILLVTLIWLPASKSPILVGSIILCPMMFSSFLTSLKGVDNKLIELSKLYNVSILDRITKLYIPSILEPLFSQSKSCISLSVKLTIAAEVLAHTMNSIGIQMQIAKTFLEMDTIFAWTIIAITLSLLLEGLISLIFTIIKRRRSHEHRVKERN